MQHVSVLPTWVPGLCQMICCASIDIVDEIHFPSNGKKLASITCKCFLLLTEPKRASATLKTPQQEVRRKQIKDVCSTKKDKFAISTGTKGFLTSPLCRWCALTDEPPLQLERSTRTQGQTDIVSL